MDFLAPDWCRLRWTPFVPFEADRTAFRIVPRQPGLYRVRVSGQPALAYVGQTGRDLRERLGDLRRHTLAALCPFNDPHTAAPKLWSYRQAAGLRYECSAAPADLEPAERLALECLLVWHYRLESGGSTLCNFGRLHPNYCTSRNRSTGVRGGLLPGGACNPAHAPSVPPLRPDASPPGDDRWAGLDWSPLSELAALAGRAPASPGVYKLLDEQTRELLYVGQSNSLGARLRSHAASTWCGRDVLVSHCPMPQLSAECQRLEVECDLIASYYAAARKVPPFQFGASPADVPGAAP